jgi:signal transduction histidine kinase
VDFTSAATHDLRAPLRGISDLVAWISEDLGPSPPETVKRNLDRVATRVDRMKRLIDDWLAYARAGHTAADLTDIDVAAMVGGILELLPRPSGFEIEIDIDPDAARLRATRVPLETALRNLIDNAIKHHDLPRGRIRISVREEDAHCVFAVTDDGPGIPFSAAEQVLAPFATMKDSDGPGVGIGLALTKQLLDLHGGRIEIRSNDAARGTTSRFWWPRLDGMVCDGSGK